MENLKEKSQTIDRKDFMKQVGLGFGAIMLMNCLQSCGETEIPDPNPVGGNSNKVDVSINITDMAYRNLQNKGGFVVLNEQKIIVARTNDDAWLAVSSVCTHEGTTIAYRVSSNDFKCPRHDAEFTSAGAVKKGPATSPLKKYNVTFSANTNVLRIFE
jgi:cytochrome b6-f complex iron-sulfur subunit